MKSFFAFLAMLLSFSASAQSEKVFFRAEYSKSYPVGTKGKHVDLIPDNTLFILKSNEVRVNDGSQWKDDVFQVTSITNNKKTFTWICKDRIVVLDIAKQTVTVTNHEDALTESYSGDIYLAEPRDFRERIKLPAPSRIVVLDSIVK